jgi:hypothetical protein
MYRFYTRHSQLPISACNPPTDLGQFRPLLNALIWDFAAKMEYGYGNLLKPGLIAAFCGQSWERIHSNLNPERVAPESNSFRVDITFAFPQGWPAVASVSPVGYSEGKAGGFTVASPSKRPDRY